MTMTKVEIDVPVDKETQITEMQCWYNLISKVVLCLMEKM